MLLELLDRDWPQEKSFSHSSRPGKSHYIKKKKRQHTSDLDLARICTPSACPAIAAPKMTFQSAFAWRMLHCLLARRHRRRQSKSLRVSCRAREGACALNYGTRHSLNPLPRESHLRICASQYDPCRVAPNGCGKFNKNLGQYIYAL